MSKNFIVCNASAGSGKTFTLVKMFIGLAFDVQGAEYGNDTMTGGINAQLRDRYKHILAITFTKKSTNEMKERIMSTLAAMAKDVKSCDIAKSMVEDAVKEQYLADTQEARDKEFERLQKYAAVVHSAVLHDYSDLSVFTIDSFMQRIVRTFAHDLHLPLNFDVTQRNEDVSLEVVDNVMKAVGNDDEQKLTQVLIDYMDSLMDDNKGYNVERFVVERCDDLFKENTAKSLDLLKNIDVEDFDVAIEKLRKDNNEYRQKIRKKAEEVLQLIHSKGLVVGNFSRTTSSIYSFIEKTANGDVLMKLNSYQENYRRDPTTGYTKASQKSDPQICEAIVSLHGDIVELINLWEEGLVLYLSRIEILRQIHVVSMMNRLNMEAQKFYDENEIRHISEFNKLIAKVVNDEPAPFVYERLGTWYRDFLLDEFQDTSHMQWHNLLPLLSNAISVGGRVFIVGDGKQAIYRFRNGDARIFTSLPEVIDENNEHGHGSNFSEAYNPLNLETNYRSMANVVEFNNHLFRWIAKSKIAVEGDKLPSLIPDVYLGKKQNGEYRLGGENEEDRSLLWQESKKDKGYVDIALMTKGEKESKADFSERMYQALYETIVEQCKLGYCYGDIMILTRNNKTLADICSYLSDKTVDGKKLNMSSAESFLLSNSRVVLLLLSTMRYVVDPTDRLSASMVILLLQQLGALKNEYDATLIDSNSFVLEDVLAQENIEFNAAYLRSLSIYECCETIMRCFGISVEDADTAVEADYIAAFLSRVAMYCNTNRQDLAKFLEWYDDQDDISAKTSTNMDSIQLLTIHKAKGLEAKIILYPTIESLPKPGVKKWVALSDKTQEQLGINLPATYLVLTGNNESLFSDIKKDEERAEEMDKLNMLYVALTRPKQKLFVFAENSTDTGSYADRQLTSFCKNGGWDKLLKLKSEDATIEQYVLGDNFNKPSDKDEKNDAETMELDHLSFADWSKNIQIATKAEPMQSGVNEAVEYGNMLHEAMSKVYHREDVDNAVAEYAAAHKLAADKAKRLHDDVCRIVNHPECEPFFADGVEVRNECEMVHKGMKEGKEVLKTVRADRIVFYNDMVYVVDYKTGSDDDAKQAKHREQVGEYCDILCQMGYSNVEGYLIYTHNDVMVVKN